MRLNEAQVNTTGAA